MENKQKMKEEDFDAAIKKASIMLAEASKDTPLSVVVPAATDFLSASIVTLIHGDKELSKKFAELVCRTIISNVDIFVDRYSKDDKKQK